MEFESSRSARRLPAPSKVLPVRAERRLPDRFTISRLGVLLKRVPH